MSKYKGRFFIEASSVVATLCVLLFMPNGAIADASGAASQTETKAAETYGKIPLSFIQNNGQTDKAVRFYEISAGHATFFTEEGVYISLRRAAKNEGGNQKNKTKWKISAPEKTQSANSESHVVKLIPLNANSNPEIIAKALQEGKINYLTGSNPEKWKTNIPTYGAVVYKDLYKGIDVTYYGDNRQLEYDISVRAGADPSQVTFSYEGIQGLNTTEHGDLEISLKDGIIIQRRPHIYQEIGGRKVEVSGRFKIKKSATLSYGFEVASYNRAYSLIIDPVLVYSTYLGSGGNYGNGIAVDASGSAYVTGYTLPYNFPTKNPFQGSNAGGYDAFVTKINASGSAFVYSTYFGGSSDDYGNGIAVDSTGSVYVTGLTRSSNFPTQTPIQGTNGGGSSDVFVTKLNASGSALVYSTYLGGSGDDYGNGIAVDSTGSVYVTGYTESTDFPTQAPIQGTNGGGSGDAFVTKINADGSALVYSTYLGGSSADFGNSIAVDGSDNAYVTGLTKSSTGFPTQAPIQGAIAGGEDLFVTKINALGSALAYSTYLGGNSDDSGRGIAVDGPGNAYVTGYTGSTNFPTQAPIQGTFTGGELYGDAFVTKINASGSALVYSTYLGGTGANCGYGIAVDGAGNAYVTGYTASTGFPTQAPIQGTYAGGAFYGDAFVAKLNAAGSAFAYSTYLGGGGDDYGNSIAVDGSGNAYVTGATESASFPTQAPIQGTHAGYYDAFVSKVEDLVCGNGIVQNGEQCDDGGTTAGDGCSATCTIESGWACSGSPSSCSLQQFTISTSVPGGYGAISCIPATVNYSGNTDCTMTPDPGYYVSDVQVGPTGGTLTPVGMVTAYTMSEVVADMTIAATFELPFVKRITGETATYYMNLQDAFNFAGGLSGDVIQLQNMTFNGSFDSNNTSVILDGGYNPGFTLRTDFSTIHGSLTITGGTLIVDAIVIQ